MNKQTKKISTRNRKVKIIKLELIEFIRNNLKIKFLEMIKKEIRINKILNSQVIKGRKE